MLKIRNSIVSLVALCACFIFFATCPAEAAIPLPPGFRTSAPLDQPDVYPLRGVRFKATLDDRKAPAGITEISYSYSGVLMDMGSFAEAGALEGFNTDLKNAEKSMSNNSDYEGRETLGTGFIFWRKLPLPPSVQPGEKEIAYTALYLERMGRGTLRIELDGVTGGKGRVKELIEFMRKGTNPA